jgi:hypothetical protein
LVLDFRINGFLKRRPVLRAMAGGGSGSQLRGMRATYMARPGQGRQRASVTANHRIGEEIKLIPKASSGARRGSNFPNRGNLNGREALGIPGTSRSRLQKLATLPTPELKAIATKIQEAGGDATVRAVLREIKGEEIKQKRAA